MSYIKRAFYGSKEVIKMLKSKRPLAAKGSAGELFDGVMSGKLPVIKRLVQRGTNLNIRRDGFTPLMFAVANGNDKITSFLIEHGADVNVPNTIGQTALMLAATIGHKKIISELLSAGANVRAIDNEGRNAITWAASRGDFPEAISLLFAFGTEPNIIDKGGFTPLMRAAMLGFADSVAVLLTIGADESVTFKGKTAYQLALERGHANVCKTIETMRPNIPRALRS